jgi:hypothetical protein
VDVYTFTRNFLGENTALVTLSFCNRWILGELPAVLAPATWLATVHVHYQGLITRHGAMIKVVDNRKNKRTGETQVRVSFKSRRSKPYKLLSVPRDSPPTVPDFR